MPADGPVQERSADLADDLLDVAPCGFVSFADDGTVRRVNRTLLDLLGYAHEEVVGQHIERLLTVGSRIFYHTHWFPLLRMHGAAEEIFLILRARSGDDIGALSNAVRREHGRETVYDCVLMQVKERKKFEDELLRARRAAEQALGELEIEARKLRKANDLLQVQAEELEAQQEQLQVQAVALEEASEELRVSNEDLLARNEEAETLRAEAESANRAKSNFLAVMSHELRTPLNAIGGYVQLIEMGIHGPVTAAQLGALDRVGRSQRHLLRLINDVLNLARIESGREEYTLEEFAVDEMVSSVLPMIEPQIAQKGIRLTVELAPGPTVRADREKAQQILLNLLGNAVKFTPDGGQIAISTAPSPDVPARLRIDVLDTGIGIPADRLAAVFEPFVQVADQAGSRRSEGSGLGLAISRDLARGMGGDLTATSAPGEGSTFTLLLPLV